MKLFILTVAVFALGLLVTGAAVASVIVEGPY